MPQHDVVGAGAAVDGLVEVVAHRVFLREAGEVGHVALLHVVEAERCRAFTRGGRGRRIIRAEVGGLRSAVCSGPDRHFDPGEQVAAASRRVVAAGGRVVAVQLLPHLVEAMHRACRVGVVGKRAAIGQLKRSGRQCADVGDALVRRLRGLAGAAGQKKLVVVRIKPVFRLLRQRQARFAARDRAAAALVGNIGDLGTANQRRRQLVLGEGLLRRVEQERIVRTGVLRRQLVRLLEVGSGNCVVGAVELDDALGEQVEDFFLGPFRHIGGEHVVEAAVFADDDDDVLDRRPCFVVAVRPFVGEDRADGHLPQRHGAETETTTPQQT